jgi:hypothetical protein
VQLVVIGVGQAVNIMMEVIQRILTAATGVLEI